MTIASIAYSATSSDLMSDIAEENRCRKRSEIGFNLEAKRFEKRQCQGDPDRQEQSSQIGLVALSRGCLRWVLISKEKKERKRKRGKEQASDVHCAGRSVLHLPPLAQLHARKGLPEKSFNGIVGI